MFSKIIIPVDGSPTAYAAIEQAIPIAQAFSSAVTVVYVVDPYPFTGVGTEFAIGQDRYMDAARAEAQAALEKASAILQAGGIASETRTVDAHDISRGILDVAQEVGADAIIMGSHGRRGLERLLLGSVTQNVLARTGISTLVVRMREEDDKDA